MVELYRPKIGGNIVDGKLARRRGEALENAILDETWKLLQQVGYDNITMDEVAGVAKTNKNTIYRRWAQKCLLVFAAISRQAPNIIFNTEDHGSLRADLKAVFHSLDPIFLIVKPKDLRELIADMFSTMSSYNLYSNINKENDIRKAVEIIIDRAYQRMEISKSLVKIPDRALNLPSLLIVNEIILKGTLSEESIEDIIDNILLPIYYS